MRTQIRRDLGLVALSAAACFSLPACTIFSVNESNAATQAEIDRHQKMLPELDRAINLNAAQEVQLQAMVDHLREMLEAAKRREWERAARERRKLLQIAHETQQATQKQSRSEGNSYLQQAACMIIKMVLPNSAFDLIPVGKLFGFLGRLASRARSLTNAKDAVDECL